ncbi:MAG: DUF255 domain-containing protein [Planctomycetes bacterium]|nr:DUF255 domain-containing protein [Planctomycetota bacterium]
MYARVFMRLAVVIPAALLLVLAAGGCEQSGGEVQTAVVSTDTEATEVMDQEQRASVSGQTIRASSDVSQQPASLHGTANDADPHKFTNRLINETSPYLLQHAHNPVDWYAWGPEAFEAARSQDKPIFLSIGYSTCYWCHVMERESFEDEETAAIMNEHFISIKVDREERPDVDDIYMAAVQTLTGSGGWPMTTFLEPHSLKPFFGGTYFPPDDRYGRPGFKSLLNQIAERWATQREATKQQADQVAQAVIRQLSLASLPQPLGAKNVDRAVSLMMSIYDRTDAGFGGGRRSNKFPMPVYIELLMGVAWDRSDVRAAVLHTLDRMAMGGMYDQVGGGFHRYSTDGQWLVPHFEKMVYDNGQLASVYADAYERTGDPYYAEIVRETLDYVLREMTDSAGGFYSAQDAEVNAREGESYLWLPDQIREALSAAQLGDDVEFTLRVYGMDRGRNFLDPHHPEDGRKNVLFLIDKPESQAGAMGIGLEDFNARLKRVNAALLAVRDRRDQPGTDDKILAGWNGLMIGGMADGARVLNEPRYIDAARRAAAFVLSTMRTDDGGLLRTYRSGQAKINAFFEDYAFMIRGLIALHRATGESGFLDEAVQLAHAAKQRFRDDSSGSYFDTLPQQADLFVRTRSTYDGAVPCGNSVMLINLLDLHELSGDEAFLDDALAALQGISSSIARSPVSAALATVALNRLVDQHPQRLVRWPTATPSAPDAVKIDLSVDRLTITPHEPATFEITLDIAKKYHINAHEPGPSFLIPLNLRSVGGDGLEIHVDYPPGERYESALAKDEMRIHRGTVTLPVRIEQVGRVSRKPQLMLVYQVCTDRACLAPTRTILPIEIVTQSSSE